MTRTKTKLELIANETARKVTFKKRKKGLLKKVSELSTLCEVDACAIIYSATDSEPDVWPNPTGARRVISRLKSFSKKDQGKKMLDQETYLMQRVAKAKQLLEKLQTDNREREMQNLVYDCLNGGSLEGVGLDDTKDMCKWLEKTIGEINKRIDHLEKVQVLDDETEASSGAPSSCDGSASKMI